MSPCHVDACHHASVTRPLPAVLATYSRSGFVEGAHLGHAVVVDSAGSILHAWGDPHHPMMARSSAKPMQATAMVRAGLELPDDLLALAASSHSGEARHRAAVRRLLESVDLPVEALRTPEDFPLEPRARDAWIQAGHRPTSLVMNCSGKHAAMLATCVRNDWSTDDYLQPSHPLQEAIHREVERMTSEEITRIGVDGCGAPVHVMTLTGLARSLSSAVLADTASPERQVVDAMRAHPEMVGGDHRDVTAFMRAVPGLVAKDGAEGVYVAALPDGRTVAMKLEDGSSRGRQVALARILIGLGAEPDPLACLARIPLLGGGVPVGWVESGLDLG